MFWSKPEPVPTVSRPTLGSPTVGRPTASRPTASRPTVAVLDHDDAFRRRALRLLRRVDATPVALLDTTAALRWVAHARPRVVIIELARLGDLLGVVAQMSDDARPLIVATSSVAGAVPRHLVRDGAAALLPRPLEADGFVGTVQELLQTPVAERRHAPRTL